MKTYKKERYTKQLESTFISRSFTASVPKADSRFPQEQKALCKLTSALFS